MQLSILLSLFFVLFSVAAALQSRIARANLSLLINHPHFVRHIDIDTNETTIYHYGSQSIKHIDYDLRNDCLLWSDCATDRIYRQCDDNFRTPLTDEQAFMFQCDIAYDWMSSVLYFANLTSHSIYAVAALAPEGQQHQSLVVKLNDSRIVDDLLVHPKRGYLFWSDQIHYYGTPLVKRSNLDGSDIRVILREPLITSLRSLTIDYATDKIYWAELKTKTIFRCDLSGSDVEEVIQFSEEADHPLRVLAHQDRVFWKSGNNNLFALQLDAELQAQLPMTNFSEESDGVNQLLWHRYFEDIQLIGSSIRPEEPNVCGKGTHDCSHLCVGAPNGGYSCICPEGMYLKDGRDCVCDGLRKPTKGDVCITTNTGCSANQFECASDEDEKCIPDFYRCDGENDCDNGDDERDCAPCPPNHFSCHSDGKCILELV